MIFVLSMIEKNSCLPIETSSYPPELDIKVEHQGTHATFLNLYISIKDFIFIYKPFYKRENFPFFIIRMSVCLIFPETFLAIYVMDLYFQKFSQLYVVLHRIKTQEGNIKQKTKQIRNNFKRYLSKDTMIHFKRYLSKDTMIHFKRYLSKDTMINFKRYLSKDTLKHFKRYLSNDTMKHFKRYLSKDTMIHFKRYLSNDTMRHFKRYHENFQKFG